MTKKKNKLKLGWKSDNREWVLGQLLPDLKLSAKDKDTFRWAYEAGYELLSDGETGVEDVFLGGLIKSPAGVVHDAINRVDKHVTPDGHMWSCWESNALYRRIKKAQWNWETKRKADREGMWSLFVFNRRVAGFRHRWRRWLGLTFSGYFPGPWNWWK